MTEPPTAAELTSAWYLSIQGDAKLTGPERAFVRDVIRRDNEAAVERLLRWFPTLTNPNAQGR